MKSQLRKMWIDSIRRQVKNCKSQKSTFKLQAPKRPTLVQWITYAWFGLSEAIITNGFAKCKIVHQDKALDETVETTTDRPVNEDPRNRTADVASARLTDLCRQTHNTTGAA
ncbi:hypothetical protein H257_14301 [Aphanomyces astaci]|uniref:DDE-1 domain-containing protein n=1 Tax=Aphanomyces astaci TaxID=112090 RepID=W4FRM1_APHAT|nr:hypothetical protein H257_14301 [Aphanomyces astaci]ETV70140.1 hypothetical protein H257_14301 [Aphanomyces astaci]|eukprot:XP_009840371.1 hypothetical protein H257_14301 [Aphanomyces astaci]